MLIKERVSGDKSIFSRAGIVRRFILVGLIVSYGVILVVSVIEIAHIRAYLVVAGDKKNGGGRRVKADVSSQWCGADNDRVC